jgi:hypothetical protein
MRCVTLQRCAALLPAYALPALLHALLRCAAPRAALLTRAMHALA